MLFIYLFVSISMKNTGMPGDDGQMRIQYDTPEVRTTLLALFPLFTFLFLSLPLAYLL